MAAWATCTDGAWRAQGGALATLGARRRHPERLFPGAKDLCIWLSAVSFQLSAQAPQQCGAFLLANRGMERIQPLPFQTTFPDCHLERSRTFRFAERPAKSKDPCVADSITKAKRSYFKLRLENSLQQVLWLAQHRGVSTPAYALAQHDRGRRGAMRSFLLLRQIPQADEDHRSDRGDDEQTYGG
jgi:hypothetical protein